MNKPGWIRIGLILLLLLALLVSAGLGALSISPVQLIAILGNAVGLSTEADYSETMSIVFWQIRLPRLLLALLVGSSLALSGAALQGLFRNPLADPTLIGISSGAALAAVLMIVLLTYLPFFSAENSWLSKYYWLNLFTFIGACACSFLVFRLARTGGKTMVATLLLAGLGVNALCAACTSLVTYLANEEELRSISFWSMGSLAGASWQVLAAIVPFTLLPFFILPALGKSLNAYSLGEAEAAYIGINVKRLKWTIITLSTLSVGAAVATCGIIGFVGLVVPHILRTICGTDHRHLLLNSALLGAVLLLLADTISRTIIAPAELPIGIVTALVGTPIFIVLLYRQKKKITL
ncbi:iron ABC transporter permease [Flavihumibacter sp. CACIAM 22H1]|uniref:FecCD family ABC transporter permease n=1 Tax=Flavihumibacter sp. CACIAM 22H1 TaxID=1812911 RepID=UPI0007A7E92F|nr:iron ABC transporter permease [Flavihumibacter sp. CACIAM 22H1]KYP13299.1 MAG: Fe3+-siderophore ABC transporter permease [Flavihumibacter sp. CACIAM 22H1]